MPSIQIKNVPDETHRVLRTRAEQAHQSLQEYLRSQLIDQAARPTIDEVLDNLDTSGGPALTANYYANLVREDRDGR